MEVGNPPQLWKTHVAIGDLWQSEGETEDARRAYTEALSVIDRVAELARTERRLRAMPAVGPMSFGMRRRLNRAGQLRIPQR